MPDRKRIADLSSYAKSPYGLEFTVYGDDREEMRLELTHTDLAFALCAMIDGCGLDNVRRAVDRIAQDDPTGKRVGLSEPARLLQGWRQTY